MDQFSLPPPASPPFWFFLPSARKRQGRQGWGNSEALRDWKTEAGEWKEK